MIAPLDSEAVLLAWAEARAAAASQSAGSASDLLRAELPNPIDLLLADPRRFLDSFERGARMGRARERTKAAFGYLVATGVLKPSRMGRRRPDAAR
jgi:hypothetical protein